MWRQQKKHLKFLNGKTKRYCSLTNIHCHFRSVLCALEEYCILPFYAPLHDCYKASNSMSPTCHRFDQSIINILLFNANRYDIKNYTTGIANFAIIKRGDERIPNYGLLKNC